MVEMPGVAPGGNGLVIPYPHLPSPPNLVVSIKAKSVNEENSSRNRLEHFGFEQVKSIREMLSKKIHWRKRE